MNVIPNFPNVELEFRPSARRAASNYASMINASVSKVSVRGSVQRNRGNNGMGTRGEKFVWSTSRVKGAREVHALLQLKIKRFRTYAATS